MDRFAARCSDVGTGVAAGVVQDRVEPPAGVGPDGVAGQREVPLGAAVQGVHVAVGLHTGRLLQPGRGGSDLFLDPVLLLLQFAVLLFDVGAVLLGCLEGRLLPER